MPLGIKISNEGINALTNTDPKNFSLYVDGTIDHILIKEQSRGVEEVASHSETSITHDLGYPPLVFVMAETGSEFRWVYGINAFEDYSCRLTDTTLIFDNDLGSARDFIYYIFYDQIGI